jgi:hypothetical protein
MRKSFGFALASVLAAGAVVSTGTVGPMSSLLIGEARAAALDGSTYAIVTPAFDGSGGNPNTSYIRFFNGGSATTTFNVTIVGSQSAKTYGQSFTVQIPSRASPQYSLGALLALAGSSAGAGAANGDTSFAVFLKDSDQGAGYQHVTFNGNTTLFENNSVCNRSLLSSATALSGYSALTNVHTSRLGSYPSVLYFFNYSSSPVTDTINVYDAGIVNSDGRTLSSTAGNSVGSTTVQIPANTTVTKNFTDIETAIHWTPSASQLHANVIVNNATGPANVIVGQSIHNATLGGDLNMTTACAVNSVTTGGSSGGNNGGSGGSTVSSVFITNASAGTAFTLSAGQGLAAFNLTNGAAILAGTASLPAGTLQANPTGSVTQTATGFTFTLPDGKTVNYTSALGSEDFEALTTDSSKDVSVKLQNGKTTLAYSTFGTWSEGDPNVDMPSVFGALSAGIPTTAAQMPTTGTVTYTGDITGDGLGATAFGQIRSGIVSLSVDFAAKTITGSVSGIVAKGIGDNSPDISMSGITLTGAISGTGFTLTATGVAAGTENVSIAGASGTFGGTFSGPNAAEIAATGSMSGNGATAIIAFGAHK